MPSKGHITTAMRKIPCPTLSRLWGIRKGEMVTYYTGDLASDLDRSESYKGEDNRAVVPALKYAVLLREIRDLTQKLEDSRRVRLTQTPAWRKLPGGRRCQVTEYVAEGM